MRSQLLYDIESNSDTFQQGLQCLKAPTPTNQQAARKGKEGIAVSKSDCDHFLDEKNFHTEMAEDQVLTNRHYSTCWRYGA